MKTLTEEFNHATIGKDEEFHIELDASAMNAGYAWDLKLKAGKASLVSEGYVSDYAGKEIVYEAGGKQVFVYRAEEAGTIEIDAACRRLWQATPPIKSHSFKITVK